MLIGVSIILIATSELEVTALSGTYPPTPGFSSVHVNGNTFINATSFNDVLKINEGSSVTLTPNQNDKSIEISATGGSGTPQKVNSLTCTGTDKFSSFNNVTGLFECTTDEEGSGGESNTASNLGSGRQVFKQKNGIDFEFRTLSPSQGITLTENANDITVATNFKIDNLSASCSGSDKVTDISFDNSTGNWIVTCETDQTGGGGGATTLASDVTCTSTGSYCTVFTIPLTASSGNAITVLLVGDSNTAGVAIQPTARFDNAGNTGYCLFRHFTTASAEVLDMLSITTTTADTGETTWLPGANIPSPLTIDCGLETDASPGNLLIQIQMETTGTGTIQKGSHYIKTP